MAQRVNNTNVNDLIELICEQGFEGMTEAAVTLMNEAMRLERDRHLRAQPYERTEERQGYANGYKSKQLKSQIGQLNLSVPQVRDSHKNFYPSFLEQGIRSERALKSALSEMYVQGVSTRRVKAITEQLCGFEISSTEISRINQSLDEVFEKWRHRSLGEMIYLILDARYEKVRKDGCVIDNAVLIAYGIDTKGRRHILGLSVSLSEHESHWRSFLQSLVERGLHGIQLIVSDAHSGLKAAKQTVFPSVPWQRCQFHLQQNAQSYVPRKNMKKEVAATIRAIFNAPNLEEAQRLLAIAIKKYADTASDLVKWMEEAIPEGLTVFAFPQSHQKRLRTSNLAERTNKEVKRRTRIVGIFPNVAACERLISALLIEMDEEWQQEKNCYLAMDDI